MKPLTFIWKYTVKGLYYVLETLLKWNQFWSIPLGLVLIFYTPWIMRVSGFDPTVGEMDSSLLFKPIFAIVFVSLCSGASWIFTRIAFPGLYKYIEDFFKEDFKTLEPWRKILVSLFVPLFYLWVTIQALNAI